MTWLDAIRGWLTTDESQERPFSTDRWSETTEILETRLVLGSLSTDSSVATGLNSLPSSTNAAMAPDPSTGSAGTGSSPLSSSAQLPTLLSQQSNPSLAQSNASAQYPATSSEPLIDPQPTSSKPSSALSTANSTSAPTVTNSIAVPTGTTVPALTAQSTSTVQDSTSTSGNALATQSVPLKPSEPVAVVSPPLAIDSALIAVNSKVLVNSSAVAAAKSGGSLAATATAVVPAFFADSTTSAVVRYDFRDLNGSKNEISDQQIQAAEQVLQDWSTASGGRIQFVRDTTSASSDIVNIGVGNLSAIGGTSAEGGTLATSTHALTNVNGSQTSVGTILLDDAETWSTSSGGSSSGGIDFSTVMAHEVGHILGLADDPSSQGIMTPDYIGAQDLSGIATAFQNPTYFSSTSVGANGFITANLVATNDQLTVGDVTQLLNRASVATPSNDAIIVIVDRNGNILGVRQEQGAIDAITAANPGSAASTLAFATDGAVSLARTAAFFANDTAPITSRTIEDLSQTTILQREVEANPNSADPTVNGPGFVAPVGIGGNFPAGIENTPHVDLFNIEASNRDSTTSATMARFNIDPSNIPSDLTLSTPISYGTASTNAQNPITGDSQNRGIATLPGGLPIYLNGAVVGGIGVFFPGKDGYATTEQGFVQGQTKSVTQEMNTNLELEAEYIAYAALGGSPMAATDGVSGAVVGKLGDFAPVSGVGLPFGFITLNGIALPLFGSTPGTKGLQDLINQFSAVKGTGSDSGTSKIFYDPMPAANRNTVYDTLLSASTTVSGGVATTTYQQLKNGALLPITVDPTTEIGVPVSSGYLVTAHTSASSTLTVDDITGIIEAGVEAAEKVRATLRLNTDDFRTGATGVRMTFAITDTQGNVLALYRMDDGTIFSTDIAVAKARNVAYYDDPNQLTAQDQVASSPGGPNISAGTAFTNRTFRFLAEPFFPSGVNGSTPPQFSILNDATAAGVDPSTGQNIAGPASASNFASVMGHDVFNPGTNFHDPSNPANQNGIVFFPGSTPLYKNGVIVGGLGVSGDGVSQDDVVTYLAAQGFLPNGTTVQTADEVNVDGVRLPSIKFDRNPFG